MFKCFASKTGTPQSFKKYITERIKTQKISPVTKRHTLEMGND
jgi:hypothetical protein